MDGPKYEMSPIGGGRPIKQDFLFGIIRKSRLTFTSIATQWLSGSIPCCRPLKIV